ncbi:MAG: hypothetical protein PF487_04415 [Bacteroidales bacterium]|jgi:ssDNA-binding Zn-finger/Zn-ribbon topoisomerase 1|nr:hypothetical protein [Bacteroidales bacterium]
MGLRKILNITTKKEKNIINDDIEKILFNCDSIGSVEMEEQKENQMTHDGQCPKCRGKDIVNKIADIQGKGRIGNDFKLGFGNVNGLLNINTVEVNHCSNCGNQWKKFKIKVVTKTDVVRVALNYLGDIYNDPEKNEDFDWKHDAIKVFENSYAETIKTLIIKHKNYLRSTTINVLTTKKLRKFHKSIFD